MGGARHDAGHNRTLGEPPAAARTLWARYVGSPRSDVDETTTGAMRLFAHIKGSETVSDLRVGVVCCLWVLFLRGPATERASVASGNYNSRAHAHVHAHVHMCMGMHMLQSI